MPVSAPACHGWVNGGGPVTDGLYSFPALPQDVRICLRDVVDVCKKSLSPAGGEHMITEIEVEDGATVLTVRQLNMWQLQRAKRVQGPNKSLIWAAFSVGMEIRQFKRLPADLQAQVVYSLNVINSSANTAEPGKRSATLEDLLRKQRASSPTRMKVAS